MSLQLKQTSLTASAKHGFENNLQCSPALLRIRGWAAHTHQRGNRGNTGPKPFEEVPMLSSPLKLRQVSGEMNGPKRKQRRGKTAEGL
jgi:hypothetical protein